MNKNSLTMVRAIVLSTLSLITYLYAPHVSAHELQPAVANLTISDTSVEGTIELALEPLILGMDLSELQDTDESDQADQYDTLRGLSPAELKSAFDQAWPVLKPKLFARAGDTLLDIKIIAVAVPETGDIEVSRLSKLTLSATLPNDGTNVTFGWAGDLGGLIVRQLATDGTVSYADFLSTGGISAPMPRDGAATVGGVKNFLNYIKIGFEHIVPKGLDHILFVLGLFFFSLKMRPLLTQITTFTLAHTVTLAMATAGIVSVPASIVEPLIALSIVFVAVENIRGGNITWRRIAVVFAFGLLHGLGFASVLGDVGLEPTKFISSLIAFNIGVEFGQLSVIAVAFIALGLTFGKRSWYRKGIAIPASVGIAIVGAYWTIERVFL
jgi:hypothetical protein